MRPTDDVTREILTVPTPPVLDISDEERDALWQMIEAYRNAAVDTESAYKGGDKAEWTARYSELVGIHKQIRSVLGFEQGE